MIQKSIVFYSINSRGISQCPDKEFAQFSRLLGIPDQASLMDSQRVKGTNWQGDLGFYFRRSPLFKLKHCQDTHTVCNSN